MVVLSEKIEFPGATGDILAARLDRPSGPIRATALFAHCFTCSKNVLAATRIAQGLAEQGIAVLRFDFTGLGQSEGEFANTNFSSNVQDLIAAAAYLRSTLGAPQLLVGHSLGGAAVLSASRHIPEVKAVATINAPADPAHVEHLLAEKLAEIQEDGEAEVCLAGRTFTIKKQFLDDIAGQKLKRDIEEMKNALLVLHAPLDQMVGIDNAAVIFQAAKHPKSFASLDGADHLLSNESDAEYAADMLATWSHRHLDMSAPNKELDEKNRPESGWVRVAERGDGKFVQDVTVDGHFLIADEPIRYGGNEYGPSPYEFVLGGLGACTTMTMRMYADRKGYPLKKASIRLHHSKKHADDCFDCEKPNARLDHIEREITLEGDLSAEQITRLLEIADRCPVHRTLKSEIRITTRLVD
jgi:putative redox protein